MNPTPNDLFLAVTTADGSVYTTTRQASNGTWSPFNKVSSLTQVGRKNVSVTVAYNQQICAINDASIRQLRYTKDLTGTTPAVLVRSGVAPASAEIGSGSVSLAVLGIGPRTLPSWSFGLPLSLVKTDQTVMAVGDELAHFETGVLSLSDPAVALDISGSFNDTKASYHLVLVTASGHLYHAFRSDTGLAQFTEVGEGGIISASCSSGREGLHVCWVSGGQISHRIISSDGTLSEIGDISLAAGSAEIFTQVAATYFNVPGGREGILHLAAVTQSGGVFYANRTAESTADPLWTTFLDIKSVAGDKGRVTSVDIGAQP